MLSVVLGYLVLHLSLHTIKLVQGCQSDYRPGHVMVMVIWWFYAALFWYYWPLCWSSLVNLLLCA